jgi:hypothetical protein
VPQSWIPPEQILELRSLVRLRRSLVEQRTAWPQRIHAQLSITAIRPAGHEPGGAQPGRLDRITAGY